ncbi:MAG: Holliday junction DNA helicase RuvA [Actinomycetes bacterium]|jgi:Holliday junction DNA helicase RuvA
MISTIAGAISAITPETVVVEVGGVGLLVAATSGTTSELRVGQHTLLFTSLVVREDSLTLYGFLDSDDRNVFATLQSVSGIGPRIAMAALSVYSADQLRAAVHNGDEKALTRIAGVGKKGAQRLILELGDKIGAPRSVDVSTSPSGSVTDVSSVLWRTQVHGALVGLGWSAREAEVAVDRVVSEHGGTIPDGRATDQHISAMLAVALRGIGARL